MSPVARDQKTQCRRENREAAKTICTSQVGMAGSSAHEAHWSGIGYPQRASFHFPFHLSILSVSVRQRFTVSFHY